MTRSRIPQRTSATRRPLPALLLRALLLLAGCAGPQAQRLPEGAEQAATDGSQRLERTYSEPAPVGDRDLEVRMNGAPMVCPAGQWTHHRKLSGTIPHLTPEALIAREEGLVLARCTILASGKTAGCRLTKSLKHMGPVFLRSLEGAVYEPVKCRGVPVDSDHTFSMQVRYKDGALSPDAAP